MWTRSRAICGNQAPAAGSAMPPHSGSVVEPVTPRLHDPSDAPGILIQRYASRRATPVFAVGLEDDDGLLVTSALRESVDPGQVVGSVEGAARRVLAAVAEGDVVSDQCRNGMLSGRLLHGLGDVLLDLLGSATVEPHRLRRVDHVADQESVFEVMVLGQVGDLGECPIDGLGDEEPSTGGGRTRCGANGQGDRGRHEGSAAEDGVAFPGAVNQLLLLQLGLARRVRIAAMPRARGMARRTSLSRPVLRSPTRQPILGLGHSLDTTGRTRGLPR